MADLVGPADHAVLPHRLLLREALTVGKIVGAFAMSHVLGAPGGLEEQAERVFVGMKELGRQLRETHPTLLIVITSDHLNNFRLDQPMPFAIGTADVYTPYGDMGLPTDQIRGDASFSTGFAMFVNDRGFKLAKPPRLRPDHGVMIPLGIVDPKRELPVVPLYVNTVYTPGPTPQESWRLGELLRAYVAEYCKAEERVALLAGGGLSHWLGVPEEGRVNETWDRWFMKMLATGQGLSLAKLSNEQILIDAGNGGLEVNSWITLAGAVPSATGEVLFYEAIPAWASGMAGMAFQLGA
ncbi:protocatechuate 3,4-dioxygenase [Steroidobacter flavus]|uniref:Protocatechuate 3,4-dioxygenase n=1 Tax=Steroidobacter flavus TaxID=1842136 RepID=A0ABV8SU73_9GAMM